MVIELPNGITAIDSDERNTTAIIGAAMYSGLYTYGGVRSSLKDELDAVRQRLQQPERADPCGSPAVLHVADDFALQPHACRRPP